MKYNLLMSALCLIAASCTDKKNRDDNPETTDLAYVGEYSSGLEGPAVDKEGNLYFVNPVKSGTIGKIRISDNSFEIFIDSLPDGSIANGIRFDKYGKMYLADYTNHNVLNIDPESREVRHFAGNDSMNQPNDLAVASNGTLYASDPDWSEGTGNIWKIDTTGAVSLLESDMGTTNGIEVAPGDSILYVNESVQRKIWSYKLGTDGTISGKTLLIEFSDFGLDGMRCDEKGNLYVARYGKGTVAIISPAGKILSEVRLKGQKPTNVAFGGKDGRTCYVTCQDRGYIEQFSTKHSGRSRALFQ